AALEPLNYAIENNIDKEYPFANAGRGLAYFELFKLEEAKSDLQIGLKENPNWSRGNAVYAWVLYELSKTKEEYEQVLEKFNTVLEKNTDYPFAYGGRGLVHYELNNYEAAI